MQQKMTIKKKKKYITKEKNYNRIMMAVEIKKDPHKTQDKGKIKKNIKKL